MAKENNEIGDIIKKCKILLLDIEGTTTSISFVKDKLFPYAEENAKGFLEGHWDSDDVKEAVAALRKQAAEDQEKSVEGLVAIPGEDASKDEQIEGLVKNVKWQMAADRKVGALKQLQGLIWKLGYDKGDIKGHVYDDVSPALELWRSTEGQKVYIYSSGSVQAQKLLFNKSLAGDMLPLIEGHFDTAVGAKQEAASYAAIVEKIGCKAEEILFLTDIVKEAEAAHASGLHAALVSREGNAPLPSEASAYPVLHSFEQLTVTNKRKPEPQIEEVPAKVPKTGALKDVKTSESEAESAKTNGSFKPTEAMKTAAAIEKSDAPETMEVEETLDVVETETETKEIPEKNEPAVETKTIPAQIAEISEKDVLMDDAVAQDVPAVIELPPVETTVAMADSTEIAETIASVSNKVTTPSGENTNAKGSTAKAEIVVPQVTGSDVQEAMATSPKSKVKMVDAATITDVNVITAKALTLFDSSAKVVNPVESKPAEAVIEATKTMNAEEATLKIEASVEKPKTEETPTAAATAEVSSAVESTTVDVVVKDTMDAPGPESKDMEADPSLITGVVESNKTEADTADSKMLETPTADLKTEDVSSNDSKPMESEDVAEADATIANGTSIEISTLEFSSVPDSTEVATKVVDNLRGTETEPVQNGVENPTDKPAEMAIEEIVENVSDQKDPDDAQADMIEPMVDKIEEKTEPNETEKMETDTAVIVEEVYNVVEPKEPAEDAVNEAILSPLEVKDITDDKESLSEVTDIIDDVVPIIEEPSHLEEMEELQNAGDVLEKECDEILSKVQDVTNLDFMPVKPLHTIAEEMETENTDTNDIVERILDSEMELSMKPEDIDLNTVQEITEPKTDTDERIGKIEPGTEKPNETPKIKDVAKEKIGVSSDAEMVLEKPVEPIIDNAKEAANEPIVEKMETEEAKVELVEQVVAKEISKPQESKKDAEVVVPVVEPPKPDETEAKVENKEAVKASAAEKASVAVTQENGGSQNAKINEDSKVNGKSNGDAIVKLNGDARKDDDLKSRLTGDDTVKEKVNGSNGDAAATEDAPGDNEVEAETPDIKVKTVATDEAHTPMEQPVEA